ncbi:MAG: hypothetical protein Q4G00_13700 [Clostridia bacterium]|nr:hypothetical protein [Clostridia bacterium]
MELYAEVTHIDQLVAKFFDIDSEELLDKKINVLTQLKNGTPPASIPDYYSILELYSADDVLWD